MRGEVADNRRPWRKLYGRRWRKARAWHLLHNPLCVMCTAKGRVRPARVLDHVTPHRGDPALFWDAGNWQSLCEPCHNSSKQRMEAAELKATDCCDVDGYNPASDW